MSVVFFLPAFLSPFMPKVVSGFVFFIDVIFSYLYASLSPLAILYARQGYLFANTTSSWLTAFIFAAQDYNWLECRFFAPPGLACSRKYANEAFIFLAFIFTFFGMLLEILSLWSQREENPHQEKNGHATPAPPTATSAV